MSPLLPLYNVEIQNVFIITVCPLNVEWWGMGRGKLKRNVVPIIL
jgi:hypothetical protein